MSVNVNIIGRLGADCEIKNSSNGKPFVVFRLATDEYKNGKNSTTWLNVVDYTEKTYKIASYLKKGALISLHGIETISLYTNKNGEVNFSRDVMSDRVDFVNASRNEPTQKQQDTSESTDQMTCGVFRPKERSAQEWNEPMKGMDSSDMMDNVDEGDDLPF